MNLLTYPGNVVYALVTAAAFLGGLFVSFVTIFGLAWGDSIGFVVAAVLGNLSTLGLFFGLIGVLSRKPSLALITSFSAAFVPCTVAVLYSQVVWKPNLSIAPGSNLPPLWGVFLLVDLLAMLLAFTKFRQLRTSR
jgi:hypothetical protein